MLHMNCTKHHTALLLASRMTTMAVVGATSVTSLLELLNITVKISSPSTILSIAVGIVWHTLVTVEDNNREAVTLV